MAADLNPSVDGELYRALAEKNRPKVIELCWRFCEGPFRVLTKRNDCVLQLALRSTQVDLVLDLLSDVRLVAEHHERLSSYRSESGNTLLHEAVTQDECIEAAVKIIELEPMLLTVPNNKQEFPIFRAARYGQMKMFKFLTSQIELRFPNEDQRMMFLKVITRINDRDRVYTILHIATFHEHFELAFCIAKKYPNLVGEKNFLQMTALQILAMTPSAFKTQHRGWLSHLTRFSSCVKAADEDKNGVFIPRWAEIRKERQNYEAAVDLARFLVERDTAWIHEQDGKKQSADNTESESIVNDTDDQQNPIPNNDETEKENKPPTPLMLATKYGCVEIVREILKQHPQAAEQVGSDYGSILHIAIQYRRVEVVDIIQKMEMPLRRLVRKNDKMGNTILHMVGQGQGSSVNDQTSKENIATTEATGKTKTSLIPWELQAVERERRNPAFQLQDDLQLFDRVEQILKAYYHNSINKKGQTAKQLFAINNEKVRDKAEEWLKRTAENCSIVAVLIATVAFAAAYTVPGGLNDQTGSPILIGQTFFVMFTITDVLSLTFSLTSVVILLSILTSSFEFEDFKESLPKKLMIGLTCLIFSVTMMMLAFAATIILMIKNKQQWTRIALYTVAFLPVTLLTVSYLPLYVPLMKTFNYTLNELWMFFPRFSYIKRSSSPPLLSSSSSDVPSRDTNKSNFHEDQTTTV